MDSYHDFHGSLLPLHSQNHYRKCSNKRCNPVEGNETLNFIAVYGQLLTILDVIGYILAKNDLILIHKKALESGRYSLGGHFCKGFSLDNTRSWGNMLK